MVFFTLHTNDQQLSTDFELITYYCIYTPYCFALNAQFGWI